MDYEVVAEQIEELRERQNVEAINEINHNQYKVVYSPQGSHSPYAHLTFNIKVVIPDRYPEIPPLVFFLDKIYHLNVDPVGGQLSMPILSDDWSPFLTLSSIFQSIDSILEQPDVNYPASQSLKQQYINQPEKYARKIEQMVNISDSLMRDKVDQSIVEHVEEINSPRALQHILINNSFEEDCKIHENSESFKNAIQAPKNPVISESPFLPKNRQEGLLSIDKEESPEIRKSTRTVEPQEKKLRKPEKSELKPVPNLANQNKRTSNQSNQKNIRSTESFLMSEQMQKFEQIQMNLRKTDELLEIFLKQSESMQKMIKNAQNPRIKQLLQSKTEKQWEMIQQLLEISSQLKEKLFSQLKSETRQLLK